MRENEFMNDHKCNLRNTIRRTDRININLLLLLRYEYSKSTQSSAAGKSWKVSSYFQLLPTKADLRLDMALGDYEDELFIKVYFNIVPVRTLTLSYTLNLMKSHN